MSREPRSNRARAARDTQHGPPAITAPPSALAAPLPAELRARHRPCPRCGAPGERFQPGVAHCTSPACGAFWSTS